MEEIQVLVTGVLHQRLRNEPNTFPLSHFCVVCVSLFLSMCIWMGEMSDSLITYSLSCWSEPRKALAIILVQTIFKCHNCVPLGLCQCCLAVAEKLPPASSEFDSWCVAHSISSCFLQWLCSYKWFLFVVGLLYLFLLPIKPTSTATSTIEKDRRKPGIARYVQVHPPGTTIDPLCLKIVLCFSAS